MRVCVLYGEKVYVKFLFGMYSTEDTGLTFYMKEELVNSMDGFVLSLLKGLSGK